MTKKGPEGSKMEPKGPNMEPTGAKMEPNGAKMEPKGPNLAQNGAERGPENIEKSRPEERSPRGRLPEFGVMPFWGLFGRKGRPGDRF